MFKSIILLLAAVTAMPFWILSQKKGSFIINTTPKYAYVNLLGFPDVEKKTPADFENYRPLDYHIQISKHNYHTLDTLITCHPDSISKYSFDLVPKTGSLNITTIPDRANVYFNNQAIGITPIENFPVPCGANTIRIESPDHGEFSNTYVINEDMPLEINKDFSLTENHNNITYSTPIETDFYEDQSEEKESTELNKSGFAHVGFFTMVGSNGAEGTAYRYGADLFHYVRIFGENNSKAGIKGFGIDFILPLDLDKVALYAKAGYLARNAEDKYGYHESLTIQFLTIGGGLSIKPSPHFQIFAEFEVGMYDEEQYYEDIQIWKEQFPSYSTVNGWLGIRVAL